MASRHGRGVEITGGKTHALHSWWLRSQTLAPVLVRSSEAFYTPEVVDGVWAGTFKSCLCLFNATLVLILNLLRPRGGRSQLGSLSRRDASGTSVLVGMVSAGASSLVFDANIWEPLSSTPNSLPIQHPKVLRILWKGYIKKTYLKFGVLDNEFGVLDNCSQIYSLACLWYDHKLSAADQTSIAWAAPEASNGYVIAGSTEAASLRFSRV